MREQNAVCSFYAAQHLPVFNITIKSHYLAHACIGAQWINPRKVWCFMGEDFMKHMRELGHSCCLGTRLIATQPKMMQTFVHGWYLGCVPYQQWFKIN